MNQFQVAGRRLWQAGGSDRLGFINRSITRRTEENSTIQAQLRPYPYTTQSSGGPPLWTSSWHIRNYTEGQPGSSRNIWTERCVRKVGGGDFRYLAQGEKYMWWWWFVVGWELWVWSLLSSGISRINIIVREAIGSRIGRKQPFQKYWSKDWMSSQNGFQRTKG